MKKIVALAVGLTIALSGCTSPLRTDTVTYQPYGIANKDTYHSDNVCYEVSLGNIVWSVVFSETVIVPVYFVGWDLLNPVRLKNKDGSCTEGGELLNNSVPL